MADLSSAELYSRPQIILPIDEGDTDVGLAEVVRLTGSERVSGLFGFDVEFAPRDRPLDSRGSFVPPANLKPDKLLGQEAAIELSGDYDGSTWIHGLISRFTSVPVEEAGTPFVYRIRLVPWLALWDMKISSRMFEDVTVVDVIETLLEGREYETRLHDSYESRKYCCQFEETDLNFFTRLLEEEGIFYYFIHEKNEHRLVIADRNDFCELKGRPRATFGDTVQKWRPEYALHSGKFAVSDFDHVRDETVAGGESTLFNTAEGPVVDVSELEQFRFPGRVENNQAARQRARVGIEREESRRAIHRGLSTRKDFRSGAKFTFQGHYDEWLNGEYLLTEVQHSFDVRFGYRNAFTCLPRHDNTSFRPQLTAARPTVPGPQTAIVLESAPDPNGMGGVRVCFHWDRQSNGSCWIRCAEMAAGPGWGTWFPTQVGHEVIVEFLNGDPDRPVITGRLYNGSNRPPESEANVMAIRTVNGQQLRFEDADGEDQLVLEGTGKLTICDQGGNEIQFTAKGISITSASAIKIEAAQVEVAAGMVNINAGITKASGVIQCDTLITNSVVSMSYTPGAGNIW